MNDLKFLFAAFCVIWAGVFIYLARLSAMRKQLEERIRRLEGRLGKEEPCS